MRLNSELSMTEIQSVYQELGLARPSRRDESTQAGVITPKPGPGEPPDNSVRTLLDILCPTRRLKSASVSSCEMSRIVEEDTRSSEEGEELEAKSDAVGSVEYQSTIKTDSNVSLTDSTRKEFTTVDGDSDFSLESENENNNKKFCYPKSECSFVRLGNKDRKCSKILSSKSINFNNVKPKQRNSEAGSTWKIGKDISSTESKVSGEVSLTCSSENAVDFKDSKNILKNVIKPRKVTESKCDTKEKKETTSMTDQILVGTPSSRKSSFQTESTLTITGDLLGELRSEISASRKIEDSIKENFQLTKSKKPKKSKKCMELIDKASNTDFINQRLYSHSAKKRKEKLSSNHNYTVQKLFGKSDSGKPWTDSSLSGEDARKNLSSFSSEEATKGPVAVQDDTDKTDNIYHTNIEWNRSAFTDKTSEAESCNTGSDSVAGSESLSCNSRNNVQMCTCACEQINSHTAPLLYEKDKVMANKIPFSNSNSSSDSRSSLSSCCSDTVLYSKRNLKSYKEAYPLPNLSSTRKQSLVKPKIFWAITKINVYPDDSRTYEVMPLTGKKPSEIPDKSDSVFVLIPPKQGHLRHYTVK